MKILVCFISHVINEKLISHYQNIKKSLDNKIYNIKFISPNNIIENNKLKNDIINLNITESLNDKLNNNHIKNNIFYIEIFNKFNNYDYYWFIENDVDINNTDKINGWKNLFNYYINNKSDLICSKINKWTDYIGYQKRYPISLLNEYNKNNNFIFDIDDIWFGFYTICRLSKKLLLNVSDFYKENDGFFEYIITSLAKYNKLSISSFTKDGFDIEDILNYDKPHSINLGSNTWDQNYLFNNIYKYNQNIILHPIKLY